MSVDNRRADTTGVGPACVGLGILGGLLILLATVRYGIGVSPDSVGYIATARHIAAGKGITSYDGRPLVAYPPLYPVILGILSWTSGLDPSALARGLNALAFAVVVSMSGLLLARHVPRVWSMAGTISVLLGIPLIYVFLMAWSEPLFILWVLLFFWVATSPGREGRNAVALAIVVSLATLTRYVGVILVLVGSGVVLWRYMRERRGIGRGLLMGTLFAAISLLPLAVWLIRNYHVSGTLFGPRPPSGLTLGQSLLSALSTMVSWYLPTPAMVVRYSTFVPFDVPQSLVLAYPLLYPWLLVMLVSIVGWALFSALGRGRHREGGEEHVSAIVILGGFVLLYTAFLVLSAARVAYDQLGHRLLSPAYVPLAFVLVLSLQKGIFRKETSGRFSTRLRSFVVVFFIAWLLYLAGATALMVRKALVDGLGYNGRLWRSSAVVSYLRQHELSCPIYTNDPNALYFLTGHVGRMSPRKTFYNSPSVAGDLSALRGNWPPEGKACLVWFNERAWNYLFTVEELSTAVDIRPIASFDDGAIYEVQPESTLDEKNP